MVDRGWVHRLSKSEGGPACASPLRAGWGEVLLCAKQYGRPISTGAKTWRAPTASPVGEEPAARLAPQCALRDEGA